MSTLAETYALQCAVPLDRPEIQECFYPLDHPVEKAILIHGFGGAIANGNQATFMAKIYDHFAEVVTLIKPAVEALGYKIYQIGAANEPAIRGVEGLCGKTSLLQCTYLVRHCALLIGNDSMWAHVRGAYGGALVALYGPTSVKCHGPYWRDDAKTILIESHRFGKKPSYASHEADKTINVIPPEQVANAALSLLGAPLISRTSLFIGSLFNQTIVEVVPNVVVDPSVQVGVPIIRMDLLHHEENLFKNLQLRKCAIIANREINLDSLGRLKANIASMRIEIDAISTDWIKAVRRLGVQVAFMSVEKDDAKTLQMRLDYYEACQFDRFLPATVDEFRKDSEKYRQKPLDSGLKLDTLSFKTNKIILSDGRVFLSRAHWAAGISIQSGDQNVGTVIDSPLFWEESAHHYIYSTTSTTAT